MVISGYQWLCMVIVVLVPYDPYDNDEPMEPFQPQWASTPAASQSQLISLDSNSSAKICVILLVP